MKLEAMLPLAASMDAEAQHYLGRLRVKRQEEEAGRKEREMLATRALDRRAVFWIARKEKDAMRHNRELRDHQLAEAARQSELARQEYMERLAREREAAAENEAARQAVKRQKHRSEERRVGKD